MNPSKKKTRASTLLSLPEEILVEILAKLPAKSVGQSRCLSKFFRSLSAGHHFADLQRSWSLIMPCRMNIFISFRPITTDRHDDMLRVHYQIDCSEESQGTLKANRVSYLDVERFENAQFGASADGLVSLIYPYGYVAICKLTTRQLRQVRQHVSFPRTRVWSSFMGWDSMFFGFDSVLKRYKVLKSDMCNHPCNPKPPAHWVFTLGVDESWRKVNCSNSSSLIDLIPPIYATSVHINGVIYSLNTLATDDPVPLAHYNIAAFDVVAEDFSLISFSDELSMRYHNFKDVFFRSALVDLDGKLASIHLSKEGLTCNEMEIWTWEEATKEWVKSTVPIPPVESEIINHSVSLCFATNHVGEIVLSAITQYDSLILFYNFRRQVWRKFDIFGLSDDVARGIPAYHFIHTSVENLFALE